MSTTGSGPTPGWYDDPSDPTMERWWDGEQWTSRVRPRGSPPGSSAPPPSYSSEGSYSGAAPSNYLPQAILTTLFCCLPLGIVAIVKASQVNGLWQGGQPDAAYKASADAKRWTWIAFGVGLGVIVLYFLAIFFFGALGEDTSSDV